MNQAMQVYGLDLSYFTGKFEAYLRYKEIPHRRVELSSALFRRVRQKTGVAQMPAAELADGRWMTDTTPMIEWLETQYPAVPVIPSDPVQAFCSFLLEDFGDEWLWRPALHYRWSFQPDARLMSERIASEMLHDVKLPLFARKAMVYRRQLRKYVGGDGITAATREHVEAIYTRTLARLQAVFETRPFLLGQRPTLADYGFYGSMFRHFGLDPTPARIMRDTAPAVFEWVARMWNAKAGRIGTAALEDSVPEDWGGLLQDCATGYLPYLAANAAAHGRGETVFAVELEHVPYRLPVHRYRVWCLEQLQARYRSLPDAAKTGVRSVLETAGCWEPLWRVESPKSGFDPDRALPFLCPGRVWT